MTLRQYMMSHEREVSSNPPNIRGPIPRAVSSESVANRHRDTAPPLNLGDRRFDKTAPPSS